MPSARAICTIRLRPTCSARRAVGTFRLSSMAVRALTQPRYSSSSFCGSHTMLASSTVSGESSSTVAGVATPSSNAVA